MSIRAPNLKDLIETFHDLNDESISLIVQLCLFADDPKQLSFLIEEKCPGTWGYARACYGNPFNSAMWRRTLILDALDDILGTHGVEPIGDIPLNDGPPYEYLNAGDPYVPTLIYCRDLDSLEVGCMADIVERLEVEQDQEDDDDSPTLAD